MKLYVLRHGKSPTIAESKVRRDADRPISEQGRQDIRRLGNELAARGGRPLIVLASPLKRAQQTANEIAAILKPSSGVKTFEPLANQLTGEMLFSHLLREAEKFPELLAVGHQPQLGEMVSYATGQIVEIRPGGLVALETNSKGQATILWSQNP